MLKGRLILLTLLFAMPGCAPFVGGSPIVTASDAASCLDLVPPSWKQGVQPVDLPQGDEVGDWVAAFDGQTGKLDTANGRLTDSFHIIGTCEERKRAAVKRATRKWYQVF